MFLCNKIQDEKSLMRDCIQALSHSLCHTITKIQGKFQNLKKTTEK